MENLAQLYGLARAKGRGTIVNTVIDIGASDGRWSKMAMEIYPESSYFLVEAQRGHELSLISMKESHFNVDYILAAAGDFNGEIYFDDSDLFGGSASHEPNVRNHLTPMVTIDSCIREKNLKPPFLLKLDTHGFEVPIFNGAVETLKNTSLIIVEAYNFDISNISLRFYQLCRYLEELGFRCVDFAEPLFRPNDKALWQLDLFFVPIKEEQPEEIFFFESAEKDSKILIIYDNYEKNAKQSETYLSIKGQSYSNWRIHFGSPNNIDFDQINEEFICLINEGYILNEHFLRVMVTCIEDNDCIICGLQRLLKNKSVFYGNYYPVHHEPFEREEAQICALYRKGYFNKTNEPSCPTRKVKNVGMGLVQVNLAHFIEQRLQGITNHPVYIYGGGVHTQLLLGNTDLDSYNIIGIIDQNPNLNGKELSGYKIFNLDQVKELSSCYVLISSEYYENEIYHDLVNRMDSNRIMRIHYQNYITC